MPTECATYTLGHYLKGKVRNVNIPDETLFSICADAGVDPQTPFADLTDKQKEISLAWLYVWMSGSPTQSSGYTEEDADWRKSETGERMSAGVLRNYLYMANKIFEKYGLDTISTNRWGFVGRGIRHINKKPRYGTSV